MNDQQNCPRLKAEERLKEIEEIRGRYAIKIAENVYNLWRSNCYSITYFASKYGFDIEEDDFLLDYIDLRIQQETGVEMLPKREKKDIKFSFDRQLELERKANSRVYKYDNDVTLSFFWAIKNNAELTQPIEVILESEDIDIYETDGLMSIQRFYKGQKVKRILRTESDRKNYQNTIYTVHKHEGIYVTVVNSHGNKNTILAHKLELYKEEK